MVYFLATIATLSFILSAFLALRMSNLLELIEEMHQMLYQLQSLESEKVAFRDLNTRLEEIQKARFAGMGSSPSKRNFKS